MGVVASLVLVLPLAGQGRFVPPGEGPVAFRRDQVPLDVATMARLSELLEVLARASVPETPSAYRAVAQMLGLSLALDPGNHRARTLLEQFARGKMPEIAERKSVAQAQNEVRQHVAWLEQTEAGDHGRALGACLSDVLAGMNSTGAEASAGEAGAWTKWIPPLSAYEPKKAPRPVRPDPPVPVAPSLNAAEVGALTWQAVPQSRPPSWRLAETQLRMSVLRRTPDNPEVVITVGSGEGAEGELGLMLARLLQAQHAPLPGGAVIAITGSGLGGLVPPDQIQPISAAAAVVVSAAMTGRQPDGLILGQVDDAGAYEVSPALWQQIRMLAESKGNGRRLILPISALPHLESLLALERAGFFLNYEVLLAKDYRQLLELSAAESQPPLAAAREGFLLIRKKAPGNDVRSYIVNRFVRQKLQEIAQAVPSHGSASLLLAMASGNRPTLVSREVVVSELQQLLSKLEWVFIEGELVSTDIIDKKNPIGRRFSSVQTDQLGVLYEECRKQMDDLDRLSDKTELDLLARGRRVTATLRALHRAAKGRGMPINVAAESREASVDFLQAYRDLAADLGVPEPEPPEPVRPIR